LRTSFGICAAIALVVTGAAADPIDDLVAQARPADEAALMVFYPKASKEYSAAPNAIIQDQVMERWDKAFCDAVNKVTTFTDWTGRVNQINFNGYFEVDLGGYIKVQDIGIEPSARLFKVVSTLRVDQPIKFSGSFAHGGEGCDVFVNREFEVHLTSITPLQ
jgi:hypothetical protein